VVENIGGRDRDRTGDLLVANEEKNLIRRGAATTYAFWIASKMGNLGNRESEPGATECLAFFPILAQNAPLIRVVRNRTVTSTFSQLRLIHRAFVLTWCMYLGILIYLHWPEKPVPIIFPMALGVVAISSIQVVRTLRLKLLFAPAAALVSDPENAVLLRRWRSGNIVSFVFAESIMLFGVVLKFLGEQWSIVSFFFGIGLLLLLLWSPRKIQTLLPGGRTGQ